MPLCDTYCQNFDFKIRRDHQKKKKIMTVATMSRKTKRAYVRKNDKKENNSGSKGLNKMKIYKFV